MYAKWKLLQKNKPDSYLSLLRNQSSQLVEDGAQLMNSGFYILKSFSSALHVTVLQRNHLLLLEQWLTLPMHLLSVQLRTRNEVSLNRSSQQQLIQRNQKKDENKFLNKKKMHHHSTITSTCINCTHSKKENRILWLIWTKEGQYAIVTNC